jgi:hypothetical protein
MEDFFKEAGVLDEVHYLRARVTENTGFRASSKLASEALLAMNPIFDLAVRNSPAELEAAVSNLKAAVAAVRKARGD